MSVCRMHWESGGQIVPICIHGRLFLLPKTGLTALNTVIKCNYNDGHLVLYPVSIKFIVIRKSSVGKLHCPEF